jgi:hypothetical protein
MPLYPYKDYKTFVGELTGESGVYRAMHAFQEWSWAIQMSHGFTCIWEPCSLRYCNALSGIAEVSTWRHTCCNLPNCGHGYHIERHGRTISSRLNKLEHCSCTDQSILMHAQGLQRSPASEASTRFTGTWVTNMYKSESQEQLWN